MLTATFPHCRPVSWPIVNLRLVTLPLQPILDEVDCPGCRNPLALGGFLRPEQHSAI